MENVKGILSSTVESQLVFELLMEDLAPAVQGNQITGCDANQARTAVMELAKLHAPNKYQHHLSRCRQAARSH